MYLSTCSNSIMSVACHGYDEPRTISGYSIDARALRTAELSRRVAESLDRISHCEGGACKTHPTNTKKLRDVTWTHQSWRLIDHNTPDLLAVT